MKRMRGGAQAHLMEADDGHYYVVKFRNNPQHQRILINELLAGEFLRFLGILTPVTSLIRVSEEFLRENPGVCIELGTKKTPVEPGWHFGSRHPASPGGLDRMAVYDYLPDSLLGAVANLSDFLGVLVFDKWIANADARQCIFFRARLKEWRGGEDTHPLKLGFLGVMVDQGFVLNGPHWDFPESPLQGLYSRTTVYGRVRSLDDFQPWLDQVRNFPEQIIDRAYRQVPPEWLEGEDDRLERVLETLMRRRKRVPDLLSAARQAPGNPFPSWT